MAEPKFGFWEGYPVWIGRWAFGHRLGMGAIGLVGRHTRELWDVWIIGPVYVLRRRDG